MFQWLYEHQNNGESPQHGQEHQDEEPGEQECQQQSKHLQSDLGRDVPLIH